MENWRCVESYTSYKEEVTRIVDCDDYTSDYQSEPQTQTVHITGALKAQDEEDIWSTTSAASTLPTKPLAVDSGGKPQNNHSRPYQMAGSTQYRGLQSFESQPSPAPSRRSQRQVSPAPSRKSHRQATMQSYPSAGDLSTYGETNTNSQSTPLLLVGSHLTLLISSLLMIGTGAGLMGFYRLHMLEIISVEFLVVPLLMLIGGVFAFITAIVGFYSVLQRDSCLLITHASFSTLEFLILVAGIISSVRLIFFIQTGLFNADVVPELRLYETNSWVRYKWDTMQREFTCCGGYSFTMGYTDWKHTILGSQFNSVPDSCCLKESTKCGANIFAMTDPKKLFSQIHTHGCIAIMQRRLEEHVVVILMVFASAGGILAIIQLLTIVLGCCFASALAKEEEEYEYEDEIQYNLNYTQSRPGTPRGSRKNESTF